MTQIPISKYWNGDGLRDIQPALLLLRESSAEIDLSALHSEAAESFSELSKGISERFGEGSKTKLRLEWL
jgi:hypothetical protein